LKTYFRNPKYKPMITIIRFFLIFVLGLATLDAPLIYGQSSDESAALLSAEQVQKIIENIHERNKVQTIDHEVTYLLGLTKNGETLSLQHRNLRDSHGTVHGFYLLKERAGYIIGQWTDDYAVYLYVDAQLKLISGVYNPRHQPGYFVVASSESAKTLHDELLVWADIADHVISDSKFSP
jgi:hypothetical protein